MKLNLPESFADLISLVYPDVCLCCEGTLVKGEDAICTRCILDLPRTHYHNDKNNPLAIKFMGRVNLDHALAFLKFRKKGNVQRLLHALKYQGNREIGLKLGRIYGHQLNESMITSHYDVIIPVPLHISRFRQRGYNQSDEWGRGISETTGISFESNVLVRGHKTETQTRKTKLNRWKNVEEIFYVQKHNLVSGKKILLVDDVVTTGATLESCAIALIEADCKSVGLACIAYAE